MYDIIIIGAGPAGMTAAIYARRAAKTVLVLEALSYGGQIINTPDIENYPAAAHVSGFDFATGVYNQAKELGAEFKFEKALGIVDRGEDKLVSTKKNEYTAKAVIIATGSENRKLGVENEDRLVGRGISYCATCDGAFYRKKTVAVVGGGNTALEDALYLSDVAEKVYLIHRRDSFRGEEASVSLLKERNNVEFVLNSTVKELHFEKKLSAVTVEDKSGAERSTASSLRSAGFPRTKTSRPSLSSTAQATRSQARIAAQRRRESSLRATTGLRKCASLSPQPPTERSRQRRR